MFRILTINPGSTSTKIGVFENDRQVFEALIPFNEEERKKFKNITDQLDMRFEAISMALSNAGVAASDFCAISARGGLLAPVRSGTFLVNDAMEEDLKAAQRGEHASNLGALLARKFAAIADCPAFIVDPVSVDELTDVARVTGAPEIKRTSLVHALNQRAVARKVANELGREYEDCRFVVAHLGTGVTIGAHRDGMIIDVVGAKADGPFSPERAGALPVDGLIGLCFSGRYTEAELNRKLLSGWGFVAHLGTRDLREILQMAGQDWHASLIYDAFVYQVAKGIGELSTVLDGELDAIILTGGMAYSEKLVADVSKKVAFIAGIEVVPGENELLALALGALRVLNGTETAREYKAISFNQKEE